MPKTNRERIDYRPGQSALSSLAEAAKLFPGMNAQALIDKLVITGLSALTHQHWQPPPLLGNDRDKWRASLPTHKPNPGK
jgi:hypothetical protein